MAWGRGGAGNIEEGQKQKQSPISLGKDHHQNAEDFVPSVIPTSTTKKQAQQAQAEQQPYAYKGRGGAGNYYSPSTLSRNGIFASTHAPSTTTTTIDQTSEGAPLKRTVTTATPSQNAGAYQGRGGAGNYLGAGAAEEEERRRQRDREREEELRVRAEQDVEMGLLKPGRAHLGGQRGEDGESERREALEREIAMR